MSVRLHLGSWGRRAGQVSLGPHPGRYFSLWPVFVQHDAAQLYLTVWNLIKDQITDADLVSPRTRELRR